MIRFEDLGFGAALADALAEFGEPALVPARIGAAARGCYLLLGCRAPLGVLSGKLLHELDPVERPVVGDWVAVADDDRTAVIHHMLPRRTLLRRRAAASENGVQLIAANVDTFFVVTSVSRDLNQRRLERYLAAVLDSGAMPLLVLNKIDLVDDVLPLVEAMAEIGCGVPVIAVSARTGAGVAALRARIAAGTTAALIGSSGVGKSSLANRLLGHEVQVIRELRDDGKGRHTTTRRELLPLPGGGLLIDTPGMREVGLVDEERGVEAAFADIAELAATCRFTDCGHETEPGCALQAAVDDGTLDPGRLDSFLRLQREAADVAARAARRATLQAKGRRRRR